MAKKSNLSIPWPFENMNIRLNTDTGLLKLIAIVTMLIDHMGAIFFPQYRVMRVIGRIAFPIYAYCLTVGCVYTHDMLRYVQRIVLLALIAQPLYVVAMHHTNPAMYAVSFAEEPVRAALTFYIESWRDPSILLSLALGLILLWSIRDRHLVITAAMLLFAWIIRGSLDYGFNGILLMLLFFLFCQTPLLSLPIVAGFMVWWGLDGGSYQLFGVRFATQMFALLALPFLYIRTNTRLRINKWVFYLFYPAHLALILVLDRLAVFA